MRWKQFLTPVESMSAGAANTFISDTPGGKFTLLDVRQPGEYERHHLPGAKLIPLPELGDRLGEIDTGRPVLVY
jgi:rhodanese-related sulfurtransferase